MDGRRGPVPKVRSETLNSLLKRSLILQDPIRPPLVRRVFSAVSPPSWLSLIGDNLVANGDRMMIDVAVWKGGADRRTALVSVAAVAVIPGWRVFRKAKMDRGSRRTQI